MAVIGGTQIIATTIGGGGGGAPTSPGGSPTQLQFNNTTFGGVLGSAVDAPTGAITLTPSADTVTPLTIDTSAFANADIPGLNIITNNSDGIHFQDSTAPTTVLGIVSLDPSSGLFLAGSTDSGVTTGQLSLGSDNAGGSSFTSGAGTPGHFPGIGILSGTVTVTGILAVAGATSGAVTFTAPAVAGVSTNAVAMSNTLTGPNGTASAPTFAFTSFPNYGLYFDGTFGAAISAASTEIMSWASSFVSIRAAHILGWAAGELPGSPDTAFSRVSAGVIAVGNGGAGDATGTVHAAQFNAGAGTGVTQTAGTPTSIATIGGIVTTLVVSSDERLKDFSSYEGGLNEILAITPIKYRWNAKGQEIGGDGSRAFVGFSAQNVQRVIPEAIVGQQVAKDGVEYLGFDDRPVIAALVNAIHELTARIKVLEARG